MRIAFTAPDGVDRDDLERGLKPAVERFGMKTELADQARKPAHADDGRRNSTTRCCT